MPLNQPSDLEVRESIREARQLIPQREQEHLLEELQFSVQRLIEAIDSLREVLEQNNWEKQYGLKSPDVPPSMLRRAERAGRR